MKTVVLKNIALSIIFVNISLTGCAVNGDGHRQMGGASSVEVDYEKIRKAKEQLNENAKNQVTKASISKLASIDQKLGTIVVGEVGVLQRIGESEQEELYEIHKTNQRKIYQRDPNLDFDSFKRTVTATCSIEVFYIPGVMTQRSNAIVPVDLIDKIQYPSFNRSYFFGSTGDLVIAKPEIDDIVMIEKVLCRKNDSDFSECKKRYVKGVFDIQTGQELDTEFRPLPDGARIDPNSYQRM